MAALSTQIWLTSVEPPQTSRKLADEIGVVEGSTVSSENLNL
jgi:hypothetical protein